MCKYIISHLKPFKYDVIFLLLFILFAVVSFASLIRLIAMMLLDAACRVITCDNEGFTLFPFRFLLILCTICTCQDSRLKSGTGQFYYYSVLLFIFADASAFLCVSSHVRELSYGTVNAHKQHTAHGIALHCRMEHKKNVCVMCDANRIAVNTQHSTQSTAHRAHAH